jgi:zinc finger protein
VLLIVETVLNIACPVCKHTPFKYSTELIKIPYFEEVVLTTLLCENCSYKYSDLIITSQNKPMEHKFIISNINDLNVRVIRSSSGLVEIPELGVKIEPVTAAESFISNIEGILVRIKSAVEQAERNEDNLRKKKHAQRLLVKIDKLRNGKGKATVLIKDPLGNSAILSKKTQKRELTSEEAQLLETGIVIFDIEHKGET